MQTQPKNGRSTVVASAVLCFLTALISAANYWWSVGQFGAAAEHRAYIDKLISGETEGPWMERSTKMSTEAREAIENHEARLRALEAK